MVEGGSSKDFSTVKTMMYAAPDILHSLLDRLAKALTAYLNAQIAAGAQVVMLFDSWGGVLTGPGFLEFSLAYMERIAADLDLGSADKRIPLIVFSKGAGLWVQSIAECGCDAVGLDWTADLADVRRAVGAKVALQGNLDPAVLYAPPRVIRREVAGVLESFGSGSGHVFNLGHGIQPQVNPDHMQVLVDAVHELSRAYH